MEPVLEMWEKDFWASDHTPPGREPIHHSEKVNGKQVSRWEVQRNKCPACMLARLGSSKRVLYALMAAMVGRLSPRRVGTKDDIKSKRIRWVRYWLRQLTGDDNLAGSAYQFGMELKRICDEWAERKRANHQKGFYGDVAKFTEQQRIAQGPVRSGSRSGESPRPRRERTRSTASSAIGIDVSGPFHYDKPTAAATATGTGSQSSYEYSSRGNPYRSSSVCSQSSIPIDLSDPFSPGFTPANNSTSNSHTRQPSLLRRRRPTFPEPQPQVQENRNYRLTKYVKSPVPAGASQKGSVKNMADSEFEWESDTETGSTGKHNGHSRECSHTSAVPSPLHPSKEYDCVDSVAGSEVHSRIRKRRSMYGDFNVNPFEDYVKDDDKDSLYDVSPACSPIQKEFENRGYVSPVEEQSRGRNHGTRSPLIPPRRERAYKYRREYEDVERQPQPGAYRTAEEQSNGWSRNRKRETVGTECTSWSDLGG